ncbi:MAG: peptidase MA family metallohydrolase [Candidatus Limnocylindrales bacterium]|jgi:hypothetical protein
MNLPVRRPAVRRLTGAVLCAAFGLLYAVGPVAAQSIVFGTPSATSKFGVAIVFTQPYSGATVKSASLLVQQPGDVGPAVLPLSSIGSAKLVDTMDTSGGGLYPNTPIKAHFEVVLTDGSVEEGPEIDITYADDRYTWHVKTGKVVRLHYIEASDSFASQMLAWGEAGIQKAATFFGVDESKPIDFFVYPSEAVFQQGLSQAGTIGGVTLSSFRTCFAAVTPGDSVYGRSVIPHELTHVAFADASDNPYHDPPRWFNEGLAVYMSDGFDASDRQLVKQAVSSGTLRSLLAYTDYFPLDASRIYLAYAESVSAIDFMIRKYGQPAVAKVVRAYSKGVTDDEAFTTGLGVDVATFTSAWLVDNGVTPTKYGPQPAPTGPVPPGWNGSSPGTTVTPGPSATGVTVTPKPSPVPGNPSTGATDDQDAYLVAAMIAIVGLGLMALAGSLSVLKGGPGSV